MVKKGKTETYTNQGMGMPILETENKTISLRNVKAIT